MFKSLSLRRSLRSSRRNRWDFYIIFHHIDGIELDKPDAKKTFYSIKYSRGGRKSGETKFNRIIRMTPTGPRGLPFYRVNLKHEELHFATTLKFNAKAKDLQRERRLNSMLNLNPKGVKAKPRGRARTSSMININTGSLKIQTRGRRNSLIDLKGAHPSLTFEHESKSFQLIFREKVKKKVRVCGKITEDLNKYIDVRGGETIKTLELSMKSIFPKMPDSKLLCTIRSKMRNDLKEERDTSFASDTSIQKKMSKLQNVESDKLAEKIEKIFKEKNEDEEEGEDSEGEEGLEVSDMSEEETEEEETEEKQVKEIKHLTTELEKASLEKEEQQSSLQSLKSDLKNLQEEYDRSKQEIEEKNENVSKLQQSIEELSSVSKELVSKIQNMTKQNETLTQKSKLLSQQNEEFTSKTQKMEKSIEEISNQNDELTKELSEKNEELKITSSELTEKNEELHAKSEELEKKIGYLSIQNGELTSSSKQLSEKSEELEKKVEELSIQNEQLVSSSKDLESKITGQSSEIEKNSSEMSEKSELIKTELYQTKNELEHTKQELSNLESTNSELSSQLKEIHDRSLRKEDKIIQTNPPKVRSPKSPTRKKLGKKKKNFRPTLSPEFLRKKNSQYKNELGGLRNRLSYKDAVICKITMENSKFQQKLDEEKDERRKIEFSASVLKKDVTILREESTKIRKRMEQYKREHTSISRDLEKLKFELKWRDRKITDLEEERRIREETAEEDARKKQFEIEMRMLDVHADEVTKVKAELRTNKTARFKLRRAQDDMKKKHLRMECTIKNREDRIIEHVSLLTKQEEQIEVLQKEVTMYRSMHKLMEFIEQRKKENNLEIT